MRRGPLDGDAGPDEPGKGVIFGDGFPTASGRGRFVPTEILPPDAHEAIWAKQQPLDFPGFVYGLDRGTPDIMVAITRGLSRRLAAHREDAGGPRPAGETA